jgi:antitoxin MazE
MKTAIRKLGNSQGVIIPKPLLAQIGTKTDDIVELTVRNGKIVIEPLASHPRAGWAEHSKAIHSAGNDKLVWPDFANEGDKDWKW